MVHAKRSAGNLHSIQLHSSQAAQLPQHHTLTSWLTAGTVTAECKRYLACLANKPCQHANACKSTCDLGLLLIC